MKKNKKIKKIMRLMKNSSWKYRDVKKCMCLKCQQGFNGLGPCVNITNK